MTFEPSVRIRVGYTPIQDFTYRIVRARQAPWTGRPLVDCQVAPRVATGLAGRGGDVKLPDFFACLRVVCSDEAELALCLLAGAVRNHLAISHQQPTGCDLAIIDLCFPAQLAGLGIEGDQESIRRAEIDHVLVDADALASRRPGRDALRIVAVVLPNQIAVGGVQRLNARSWSHYVHDAAIDDRRRFLRARRETARPCHAQLSDIAFVDLVQWTETMLIVRSADVEPVRGIRIRLHRLRDRNERSGLCGHPNCGTRTHNGPK